MSSMDYFRRPQLVGVALPTIPYATIRGSIRRHDADGVVSDPYFPLLTIPTSLDVKIDDAAPVTVTFSTDNKLSQVLADLNAALAPDAIAYDADGCIGLKTTTVGGAGSIEVDGGTAAEALGFTPNSALCRSVGGEVPSAPEGRLGNPFGTAFPLRSEGLTFENLNRAMARVAGNTDILYADAMREDVILQKLSGYSFTESGRNIRLSTTDRVFTHGVLNGTSGWRELQDYFQIVNVESGTRAANHVIGVVKGAQTSTTLPYTDITDWADNAGENILGIYTDLFKVEGVAITSIVGADTVVCTGADFNTANVVPGDLVTIRSATNTTPFDHNGRRWIVERVRDQETLELRPASHAEMTIDGSENEVQPILELNPAKGGGESYGLLDVRLGAFKSDVTLVVDPPLPPGTENDYEVWVAGPLSQRLAEPVQKFTGEVGTRYDHLRTITVGINGQFDTLDAAITFINNDPSNLEWRILVTQDVLAPLGTTVLTPSAVIQGATKNVVVDCDATHFFSLAGASGQKVVVSDLTVSASASTPGLFVASAGSSELAFENCVLTTYTTGGSTVQGAAYTKIRFDNCDITCTTGFLALEISSGSEALVRNCTLSQIGATATPYLLARETGLPTWRWGWTRFENCKFENWVPSSNGAYPLIYADRGIVTIDSCTFTSVGSPSGDATILQGNHIYFTNNYFESPYPMIVRAAGGGQWVSVVSGNYLQGTGSATYYLVTADVVSDNTISTSGRAVQAYRVARGNYITGADLTAITLDGANYKEVEATGNVVEITSGADVVGITVLNTAQAGSTTTIHGNRLKTSDAAGIKALNISTTQRCIVTSNYIAAEISPLVAIAGASIFASGNKFVGIGGSPYITLRGGNYSNNSFENLSVMISETCTISGNYFSASNSSDIAVLYEATNVATQVLFEGNQVLLGLFSALGATIRGYLNLVGNKFTHAIDTTGAPTDNTFVLRASSCVFMDVVTAVVGHFNSNYFYAGILGQGSYWLEVEGNYLNAASLFVNANLVGNRCIGTVSISGGCFLSGNLFSATVTVAGETVATGNRFDDDVSFDAGEFSGNWFNSLVEIDTAGLINFSGNTLQSDLTISGMDASNSIISGNRIAGSVTAWGTITNNNIGGNLTTLTAGIGDITGNHVTGTSSVLGDYTVTGNTFTGVATLKMSTGNTQTVTSNWFSSDVKVEYSSGVLVGGTLVFASNHVTGDFYTSVSGSPYYSLTQAVVQGNYFESAVQLRSATTTFSDNFVQAASSSYFYGTFGTLTGNTFIGNTTHDSIGVTVDGLVYCRFENNTLFGGGLLAKPSGVYASSTDDENCNWSISFNTISVEQSLCIDVDMNAGYETLRGSQLRIDGNNLLSDDKQVDIDISGVANYMRGVIRLRTNWHINQLSISNNIINKWRKIGIRDTGWTMANYTGDLGVYLIDITSYAGTSGCINTGQITNNTMFVPFGFRRTSSWILHYHYMALRLEKGSTASYTLGVNVSNNIVSTANDDTMATRVFSNTNFDATEADFTPVEDAAHNLNLCQGSQMVTAITLHISGYYL
jgi:hypothetical protein